MALSFRHINLDKDKDSLKCMPLKIFTKDTGNCAYCKTVTIRNSDTAKEVITMSLPMLRVAGSERDYQLWVSSGKEEAPCPLTGHGYPHGIQVSHLRDTAVLTQGPEDSASPSHLPEPFLLGQLPPQMRCQFTLQPRRLAATSSSVTRVRRHLKGGPESGPLVGC